MAKFRGAELVCCICGKDFRVPPSRANKATTCSHACSVKYRAQGLMQEKVAFECPVCGITFFEHKSRAGWRRFCSNECRNKSPEYRSELSARTSGEGNAMWIGGVVQHADGYLYERSNAHPLTSNGYVHQHRLVVERHLLSTNPDSKALVQIGNNKYLDPQLVVHHKNLDRKDNRIENLQVMTNSDHQALHNRLRVRTAK